MALTGFASPAWAGQNDASIRLPQGHLALAVGRLKGVLPLLHTPAWALHGDLHGDLATQTALLEEATLLPHTTKVLDLGPRAHADLQPPHGWTEVRRHTRQVTLSTDGDVLLPKTRGKQARRFVREGGTVAVETGHDPSTWSDVERLHAASRDRKGLASHQHRLAPLLERLATEPWTFAVTASNAEGKVIASGGFVLLPCGTCVYAFGGQDRSKDSGRASVAMLCEAMRTAQRMGATTFDFGGSQDAGVDKFYAEFGGVPVAMRRWVNAPVWFKWVFPKTWNAWTTPSRMLDAGA
ncbi:MAG: GNAT family N-acetyltransferase [Flavobacteriales bacterium]